MSVGLQNILTKKEQQNLLETTLLNSFVIHKSKRPPTYKKTFFELRKHLIRDICGVLRKRYPNKNQRMQWIQNIL